MIVSRPLAGDVRPSASNVSGSRSGRATHVQAGDVDAVPDRDELARPKRERPLVDAENGGREPRVGRREQPATAPMREPEHDLDAGRTGERRRKHRVDRAHVREDGGGTRPPNELARERGLETEPAAGTERRAKEAHAAVRRERSVDGAVREDDELVDACGESSQLVDGRAEHGARGIDLLGDDDEPHPRRASTARPTSSRTLSAYSSAVYVHSAGAPPRLLAEALGEVAVGQDADERVGDLVGSIRIDEQAGLAVPHDIRDAAGPRPDDRPAAAQGLQHDTRCPLGSGGEQEEPGVVERPNDVGRLESRVPCHAPGEIANERLRDVSVAPVADDAKLALRDARGGEPPRFGDRVDVLVALEDADEQRRRPVRQAGHRRVGERRQLGVGRERADRLDPCLANDPARERRQRANGVRVANRDERSAIREGGDHGSRLRAVEPRPCPPVAVDLDDDGRVAPGEPAACERPERLVRALRQDRVRWSPAQLACDPERQRAVEPRPVERRQSSAALEQERRVPVGRTPRRGREDTKVESFAERVELPLERRAQRNRVPRAADHEDARLHSSSSIACTIRRRIRGSASSSTDGLAAAASDARSPSSWTTRSIARAIASTSCAGTSSPFTPSRTTSGMPPTAVAITGVPDGQRLEQRMRQVLPRRGQQHRVDGSEEGDDVLARPWPEKPDPSADAKLRCAALEPGPLGALTEHEQLDVRNARDGGERVVQRLLRRQPPGGAERGAADPEGRARALARWQRRQVGAPGSGRPRPGPARVPSRARSHGGTRSVRERAARAGAPRCGSYGETEPGHRRVRAGIPRGSRRTVPTGAPARTPRPRRA